MTGAVQGADRRESEPSSDARCCHTLERYKREPPPKFSGGGSRGCGSPERSETFKVVNRVTPVCEEEKPLMSLTMDNACELMHIPGI